MTERSNNMITGPALIEQVFNPLSADIQNYLSTAKKFSSQHKHMFIGLEHMFAAFLMNKNSYLRRFINRDKVNWKKKINLMLTACYASSNKPLWSGYFVTPRMQKVISAAISRTRFKEPNEVGECHILIAMLADPDNNISRWIVDEKLEKNSDGISIRDYLSDHLADPLVKTAPSDVEAKREDSIDDVDEAPEKEAKISTYKSFNIFSGLKSLFNKKSEHKEVEEEQEVVELTPPIKPAPEVEEKVPEKPAEEEPEKEQEKEQEKELQVSGTRSLKVGNRTIFVNSSDKGGLTDRIINRLVLIAEKHGTLPEVVTMHGQMVPFEEFLAANLPENEYAEIIEDFSSHIRHDANGKTLFGRRAARSDKNKAEILESKRKQEAEKEQKDSSKEQVKESPKEEPSKKESEKELKETKEPKATEKVEESKESVKESVKEPVKDSDAPTPEAVEKPVEEIKETPTIEVEDSSSISVETVGEGIDTQISSALKAEDDTTPALQKPQAELAGAAALKKSSYKPVYSAFGATATQITPMDKIDISTLSEFTLLTGINEKVEVVKLFEENAHIALNFKAGAQHMPEFIRVSSCMVQRLEEVTNRLKDSNISVELSTIK